MSYPATTALSICRKRSLMTRLARFRWTAPSTLTGTEMPMRPGPVADTTATPKADPLPRAPFCRIFVNSALFRTLRSLPKRAVFGAVGRAIRVPIPVLAGPSRKVGQSRLRGAVFPWPAVFLSPVSPLATSCGRGSRVSFSCDDYWAGTFSSLFIDPLRKVQPVMLSGLRGIVIRGPPWKSRDVHRRGIVETSRQATSCPL